MMKPIHAKWKQIDNLKANDINDDGDGAGDAVMTLTTIR